MKRGSTPYQFLAAAATDSRTFPAYTVAAAAMSSRPPYQGGRTPWRRNFSDRSGTGGRGQFVTGDSHFQSVRDTNLGIRQGGFSNQNGFRPQRLNPRAPPYNQNPQFRHPPSFIHNQYQRFRQPPPSDQNQQFRPPQQFGPRPPKPLDYRGWEYAKTLPPPDSKRFVVLSYNILADYLAINHRSKLYFHVPRHMLDWQWRKGRIIFELGLWSADIMCFQEVDRFQDLYEELKLRGYSGIWKMRTGDPIDGCAIFWRTSRFKLLHEESIEFNKLGLRDNVAQICVLELGKQLMTLNGNKSREASPTSSTTSNKVVICNIHVLYNPRRGEIKIGQVRTLLNRAHAVSKIWDDAPVVLCGDFNCTPKSPLYNFIYEQKLELSELDRDKVSGQASAEIRAPRADNPHGRIHSTNSSIEAASMVNKVDGDKLSDSISESQKQNDLVNSVGSLPCIDKLSSPQIGNPVSDESCTRMQCRNELLVTVENQNVIDHSVGNIETHILAAVDGSGESPIAFHREDGFSFDSVNGEIHGVNTPAASGLEDVSFNATEMTYCGKVHANFVSNGACELSGSNICMELENTNDSPTASLEITCPAREGCSPSLSFVDDMGSSPVPDEVNVSSVTTIVDSEVDKKLEKLSLNELDDVTEKGREIPKDDSACLSALHNAEDGFPPDLGPNEGFAFSPDSPPLQAPGDEIQDGYSRGLDLEIVDVETYNCDSPKLNAPADEVLDGYSPGLDSEIVDADKFNYDPSLWTPMEFATASGNVDCTFLEHHLKLKSTYTEVEDCSGTRDKNGEPLVTSYNRRFFGTVDYIWRSEGLHTVRVLAPIPTHAMQWTPGFPTKKWGSDHVALASELAFTKDKTDQNMEVS